MTQVSPAPAHAVRTKQPRTAPPHAPAAGATAPSPSPTGLGRILVVDHSAVLTSLLQTAIAGAGYGVETAAGADEAIATLRAGTFDLVILELDVADARGRSLLRLLREQGAPISRLPVIVLTDRADRASVLAAISMRISGYILKSQFRLESLLERIHQTVAAKGQAAGRIGKSPTDSDSDVAAAAADPETPVMSLRDLRPLLSRSQLDERLRGCEQLKAFSPSVNRVLKLTSTPGASMDSLVTAVSQDHAIALKLLKIANSAALNTGEPVDSVKKAVLRMGMEKVRQAVLNIGVVDRFSSAVLTERFNFANFWEHSIACGLIAAELAKTSGCMDADNAFAMGLLHDVGRVAMIEQLPEEYARVLEAAERLGVPLEQTESRLLLVNHADVMGRLLRSWRFPKELVDPITLHHVSASNARSLVPSRAQEVAVLALANRLAHALLLGSSGNDVVYPATDLMDLLRVDAALVARLESMIPDETGKIKLSMLAVGSGEVWPMVRDRHRATLEKPLRPLFVSPDPMRDTLRIFCNALADEDAACEAPNLAVVHVPDSRATTEAGNLLRAAESAAGVSDLPLIVLSPSGKVAPSDDDLAERPAELLPTPFAVARFVEAVNRIARVE